MHPVQKIINECDLAIAAEDFDTLMANYTEDAVLVVQPGVNAIGKSQIREAFLKIAVYFKHGLEVEQAKMEILDTGNTALVLAKTLIRAPGQGEEVRKATYVFNRVNGRWLCSIDNSYGHQLLERGSV